VLNPSFTEGPANNNEIIIGNRGKAKSTDDFAKQTVLDNGRMPYRQAGLLVSESFGGIATDV